MKLGAVIYTPPQSGWGGGEKGASLSPCPHLWFAVAPALIIPPEVFAAPLQHHQNTLALHSSLSREII